MIVYEAPVDGGAALGLMGNDCVSVQALCAPAEQEDPSKWRKDEIPGRVGDGVTASLRPAEACWHSH